jgi:hypothetical protein
VKNLPSCSVPVFFSCVRVAGGAVGSKAAAAAPASSSCSTTSSSLSTSGWAKGGVGALAGGVLQTEFTISTFLSVLTSLHFTFLWVVPAGVEEGVAPAWARPRGPARRPRSRSSCTCPPQSCSTSRGPFGSRAPKAESVC